MLSVVHIGGIWFEIEFLKGVHYKLQLLMGCQVLEEDKQKPPWAKNKH